MAKVLLISNGHGEDNDAGFIIEALRRLRPELELAALPIVGQGAEYRRRDVPIIGPVADLPSGGFTKTNRLRLLGDAAGGLVGLTIGQIRAARRHRAEFDLVLGIGDGVAQSFAAITGRPFIAFITSLSALYEDHLTLEPILRWEVRRDRCLALVTRDLFTARNLTAQGYAKVRFGGLPSTDSIVPTGRDLAVPKGARMVALLPGSRPPEADRNLATLLRLAEKASALRGDLAFRAALVPRLRDRLGTLAEASGWALDGDRLTRGAATVICPPDAFADILTRSDAVAAMAGLAAEQAVVAGKPVIQIPGTGPQYTWKFAEAQTRLLGVNARLVGTRAAGDAELDQAARLLSETLDDADYLARCATEGPRRLGTPGGAERIARMVLEVLDRGRLDADDLGQFEA
ncbi:lipid-A-disaccharide synthase-related protein [Anianabacter salinae]|uniref:lipid-A-disaccharide synthase-related protein n=1 Tax=Anianabacter salinae TaxID=2851023 RepID=UPI00225E3F2A|nr:lipid-A-disaccharide synthase-related protein [Anianabacter salinae]MBV0910862.1 lipid-A-disaccharide synthase-related protein [Anianabacter salinae]